MSHINLILNAAKQSENAIRYAALQETARLSTDFCLAGTDRTTLTADEDLSIASYMQAKLQSMRVVDDAKKLAADVEQRKAS